MIIVFLVIMALIVAFDASNKGHSFVSWFIYAFLLLPIAFIHVILIGNKSKKCPDCCSKIDAHAVVCRYCKHQFSAEELKSENKVKEKSQRSKTFILILCAVTVVFFFIAMKPFADSAKEQQNNASQIQQKKRIPYEVKQISQSNGVVNFIIVDSKNVNINDLTVLGQELHADYANASFMRISIYDDLKAVQMRDRVINDQATKDETVFYDTHYIAQYNKNSNTRYNQFMILRDETGKVTDKVINY